MVSPAMELPTGVVLSEFLGRKDGYVLDESSTASERWRDGAGDGVLKLLESWVLWVLKPTRLKDFDDG